MPTVRHAHRAAQAKAALREIQAVSHAAADAVVGLPFNKGCIHAAL